MKLYFVIVLALISSVGAAAAAGWQVASRHGTVLMLNGDQWDYLPEGGEVERGIAIRTLKGSTIALQYEGYVVELQPNSATRFERSVRNTTVVTQFAGVVRVSAKSAKGHRLLVNTPGMAVYVEPGTAALTIYSDTGQVDVAVGVVNVLNAATKATTTITAGETFEVTAAATGNGNSADANLAANGNGAAKAAANGNKAGGNGNGNGNAGGNGNGNAGGNGNGNSGGNGNAGGNGNGNSSNNAGGNSANNQGNNGNGNGNSNSNGNGGGNSAAGGNGGGNGNGNGNGNGKGHKGGE